MNHPIGLEWRIHMLSKYIPCDRNICMIVYCEMQTSYSSYRLLVTALIILWLTIMMRLIKELIIHKQPHFLPWQIFSVHKYMKVYRNIPDIKVIINSILYVQILSHFIQGIIIFCGLFWKGKCIYVYSLMYVAKAKRFLSILQINVCNNMFKAKNQILLKFLQLI